MEHHVTSDNATISYEIDGVPEAPALLLINSIGSTRELWARQMPAFAGAYRVIRYDARGHGRSSVPPGDYTIEQLGRDAQLSAPTPDHYLPLLYILGTQQADDTVSFPIEGVDGGSISMLTVQIGGLGVR